jgi:antitoxin VapB
VANVRLERGSVPCRAAPGAGRWKGYDPLCCLPDMPYPMSDTPFEVTTMLATAKIDTSDQRQTVRLPAGFELASDEVWVRKDEATGDVILSPKPPGASRDSLRRLFALLDQAPLPEDFLEQRPNPTETPRNPLEDWPE